MIKDFWVQRPAGPVEFGHTDKIEDAETAAQSLSAKNCGGPVYLVQKYLGQAPLSIYVNGKRFVPDET